MASNRKREEKLKAGKEATKNIVPEEHSSDEVEREREREEDKLKRQLDAFSYTKRKK